MLETTVKVMELPHVQILIDRRDAETIINRYEDEAHDGISQQHPIQGFPHSATMVIQLRGITQEGTYTESTTGDRQHHRADRHVTGSEHVICLGLLFLRLEVSP